MNNERVKLINNLLNDPLLKSNFTNISFVELSSNEYTILTLFRKNRKSYQNNIMFYFCGYNDYFYHTYIFNYKKFNFDILVIDIPGFGFNKKYNDHKLKIKNNYYDDINKLNNDLDTVFNYINNHRIYSYYKKKYLYAHSTGGNIIINYLYHLQTHNKLKNRFDKVILNSPLTRFTLDPQNKFPISWIIELLFRYIINIIGLFTNNLDINIFNKIKILKYYRSKKYDKLNNKSLNLIYKTNNIIYINSNFSSYSNFPMMIGWYRCVENSIYRIIKSNKKININIKLIITKNDKILNHQYIKDDIKQLFKSSEIKISNGVHDCLVTEDYEDVLNFILN